MAGMVAEAAGTGRARRTIAVALLAGRTGGKAAAAEIDSQAADGCMGPRGLHCSSSSSRCLGM